MIEKLTDLYHRYSDQFMTWFSSLDQLYQIGLMFAFFVAVLLVLVFFLLSRISR